MQLCTSPLVSAYRRIRETSLAVLLSMLLHLFLREYLLLLFLHTVSYARLDNSELYRRIRLS